MTADPNARRGSQLKPDGQGDLPPWKAFVVQFSREATAGGKVFAGRVEHLGSGRRARFASGESLISVLETLLREVGANDE